MKQINTTQKQRPIWAEAIIDKEDLVPIALSLVIKSTIVPKFGEPPTGFHYEICNHTYHKPTGKLTMQIITVPDADTSEETTHI